MPGTRAAFAGPHKLGEARLHRSDEVDDPELVDARDEEQSQQEQGLDDATDDEDPLPIPAVDEDAAELTGDEARDELDDEDGGGDECRPGELEDEDRQGEEERPVAEVVDEAAGPEPEERTVAERGAVAHPAPRTPGRRTASKTTWTRSASGGAPSRVRLMYGRSRASTAVVRVTSSSAVTISP